MLEAMSFMEFGYGNRIRVVPLKKPTDRHLPLHCSRDMYVITKVNYLKEDLENHFCIIVSLDINTHIWIQLENFGYLLIAPHLPYKRIR